MGSKEKGKEIVGTGMEEHRLGAAAGRGCMWPRGRKAAGESGGTGQDGLPDPLQLLPSLL